MNTIIKPGRKVLVECFNSKLAKSEWKEGVFNQFTTALDRDFRVNVTLSNGITIPEAAPECIKYI